MVTPPADPSAVARRGTARSSVLAVLAAVSVLASLLVAAPPAPATAASAPEPAISITAGYFHTCALLDNGSATCWGENLSGQLGNGAPPDSVDAPTTPIALPAGRTATALGAGGFHTCALLDNGGVSCWGDDSDGQLGNGASSADVDTPPSPVTLPAGRTATGLAVGELHTCALLDNGSVSCWGDDSDGQLGNGAPLSTLDTPSAPITLPAGRTATALAAGSFHTCALLDNGSVTCWGLDDSGQAGNGAPPASLDAPSAPITLPAGRTAVALAGGGFHTCALLDNGSVTCWGDNDDGQVGNGTAPTILDAPSAPITLPAGRSAVAITAGLFHTCAVLDDGGVSCWGLDDDAQLGNGASTDSLDVPSAPITLPAGRSATGITAGEAHTCAVLDNGQMSCWGFDGDGQLGNGAGLNSTTEPGAPFGTERPPDDPDVVPQTPARFYETRPQPETTFDGQQTGTGRRTAGQITPIQITGRNNIPTNATAAVVNVTAITPDANGFITLFPCGDTQPGASMLNYTAGQIIANGATVKLGTNGTICVFTHQAMDLIVDVTGYLPADTDLTTQTPARFYETRPQPETTFDVQQTGTGRRTAGQITPIQITGRNNIPTNATAAVVNVTAITPDANGFITLFPCGDTQPGASMLNYTAGQIIANGATVKLGTNGTICVFTHQAMDLIVDVTGYLPADTDLTTQTPARFYETRPQPETTFDVQQTGTGRRTAGQITPIQITGRNNIPTNATAAVVNVTAITPDANGFITLFPCGDTQPGASMLNYTAGQIIANGATVKLGTNGTICVFTHQAMDLIVDVTGYLD